MPEDHVVMEFSQISDFIFLGTNSCCQEHFEEKLLDKGITVDISLEGERIDAADGVDAYLWLPTVDHEAPTQRALWLGADFIGGSNDGGEKVYVHCKNGHGRGPTLVVAYFVKTGMSVDEAVDLVKAKRPEIHIEDVQKESLELFSKNFS